MRARFVVLSAAVFWSLACGGIADEIQNIADETADLPENSTLSQMNVSVSNDDKRVWVCFTFEDEEQFRAFRHTMKEQDGLTTSPGMPEGLPDIGDLPEFWPSTGKTVHTKRDQGQRTGVVYRRSSDTEMCRVSYGKVGE